MIDWWHALVYGIIQGLTEFLPVSSSGHLAILPKIFSIDDPGVSFDLMMHVGTALAVLFYYHKKVKELIIEFFLLVKTRKINQSYFFINFFFCTMITGALGLVFKNYSLLYARGPFVISLNLIVFGILMFISDRSKISKSVGHFSKEIRFREILLIGVFQALAVFPGVSRSGITLTASRFLGHSRVESTHFSFLLSLPLIFAGALLLLPDYLATSNEINGYAGAIGFFVSFIIGLLSIHLFIKIVQNLGLWVFTLYRVFLGIILIAIFS